MTCTFVLLVLLLLWSLSVSFVLRCLLSSSTTTGGIQKCNSSVSNWERRNEESPCISDVLSYSWRTASTGSKEQRRVERRTTLVGKLVAWNPPGNLNKSPTIIANYGKFFETKEMSASVPSNFHFPVSYSYLLTYLLTSLPRGGFKKLTVLTIFLRGNR